MNHILRKTLILASIAASTLDLSAQNVKVFKTAIDSLEVRMQRRTTVYTRLSAKKIVSRGNSLDFHFTSSLGDYPWRTSDVKWFKDNIKELMPEAYKKSSVGEIYVGNNKLADYIVPDIGDSGEPIHTKFRTTDHRSRSQFVRNVGEQDFNKGMTGRNIALWQSHGRYFEEKTERWEWQRAPVFQTVEDMYTQSYVLPFLIPMLENAGAYVMTPRERDTQTTEIIADNDPAFKEGRGRTVRLEGRYSETGAWKDAGVGFADSKPFYVKNENPFRMGTARQAECVGGKHDQKSEARWTADFPQRGEYSVYVSYKSLPNSTTAAHYTVKHMGGVSEFHVNQKMGGGTWIYLGTFEFDKESEGCVILDNGIPEGREGGKKTVVTADAVRFGGGMGKIARGTKDQESSEYTTSGMPSFTEGALYWMQWAGADTTLLNLHPDDYTSDYADRGPWVNWMSGGSRANPREKGLGIPIDLSFSFHTDAGTTNDDSIIGTLSIYTLLCDGSDKFPGGESRLQQRMYADFVQSQIVDDIRASYNQDWTRRGLWDRSYSESRTPAVPAMLLELLSHQNFADMKYGLDPSFRFTVSRAIYKGMLKFLSSRYGCEYVVQPLPVNSFATSFRTNPVAGTASQIRLSWKVTTDLLEPTSSPTGYILQTRIDDGAFDEGRILTDLMVAGDKVSTDLTIRPGHIYSYRVIAFNEGGKSFPSEVLSIGVPIRDGGTNVMIVNNFTRVSSPSWFDTSDYAGFTNHLDAGVGYVKEINFIGPQYQFRRELEWKDDDNPGFGASFINEAGKTVPGNTFDFTAIHGRAFLATGHPFHSVSTASFQSGDYLSRKDKSIDIICGKQVTTMVGSGKVENKYQVFPEALQKAIKEFTDGGGNVLISGANIGTDVWDKVFPIEQDSVYTAKTIDFVEKTLGYRWLTNFATNSSTVKPLRNRMLDLSDTSGMLPFRKDRNQIIYNVETPDGIVPSSENAFTFLRYSDTDISAGTCFKTDTYRTVCLGFPIETLNDRNDMEVLIGSIMRFFEEK